MAVEPDQRVASQSVCRVVDAETTVVPFLATAGLVVEARFSLLRKSHFEAPADGVAGWPSVASVVEALRPLVVEGIG